MVVAVAVSFAVFDTISKTLKEMTQNLSASTDIGSNCQELKSILM